MICVTISLQKWKKKFESKRILLTIQRKAINNDNAAGCDDESFGGLVHVFQSAPVLV